MAENDNTNQNNSSVVEASNIKNSNVNITSIIEDNSGGLSSTRILMLLWGVGVFLVWGIGCGFAAYHGVYTFPSIPPEVVTILLGITGIKTVQRFGER